MSWDKICPDFQRKSAQFDELHPENALTYFPTEDSWTLTARPERVRLESRFPSKFAVGSLPLTKSHQKATTHKRNRAKAKVVATKSRWNSRNTGQVRRENGTREARKYRGGNGRWTI